jgi:hypothetical protein
LSEKRKLKVNVEVERVPRGDGGTPKLSKKGKAQAEAWVVRGYMMWAEAERKVLAQGGEMVEGGVIPAGTEVEVDLKAHHGGDPDDDPNPLLRVEAADGRWGYVGRDDTEPV